MKQSIQKTPAEHWVQRSCQINVVSSASYFKVPNSQEVYSRVTLGPRDQPGSHSCLVYFSSQFGSICSNIFQLVGWKNARTVLETCTSVIGGRMLPVASRSVNLTFEREGAVMAPKGCIVCKQVCTELKAWV